MFQRSSLFRKYLAPSLVLALALANVGCGRFTRTRQCRKLVALVNPTLDEISALAPPGSGGAAYVAAATRYEALAKTLGPMEFSSEQMAKSVADYASTLTSTAQALRLLAAALDANNGAEADKQNHEIERLSVHERSAVAHIDAWCQPGE